MKRAVLAKFLTGFVCLSLVQNTWADPPEVPAAQLGRSLRAALGLGPQELATLGVDATLHGNLISATNQYCNQNRQTIEPLLVAYEEARRAAFAAYESPSAELDASGVDQSCDTKDAALRAAVTAMHEACSGVTTAINSQLSTAQQTLRTRSAAAGDLDVGVAFLDLNQTQRQTIRAAQRERDQVLKHQRLRKNQKAMRTALQTYNAVVEATLTTEQREEAAAQAETRSDHLRAITTAESQSVDAQ